MYWLPAFCGDQSLLCKVLQSFLCDLDNCLTRRAASGSAITETDIEQVPLIAELDALLEWGARSNHGWPALCGNYNQSGASNILQGLRALARAAALAVVVHRDPATPGAPGLDRQFEELCRQAVHAFDTAWNWMAVDSDTPHGRPSANGGRKASETGTAVDRFDSLDLKCSHESYWIARDVLAVFVGEREVSHLVPHHAVTPVLGAELTSGDDVDTPILWLTVELIPQPNGGVFCPDPLFHGLMDVGTYEPGTDHLVTAMQEVWEASGLASRFRGRWRFTTECPKDAKRNSGQEPVFVPRVHGRSAQGAALVALLAASGDPYLDGKHGRIDTGSGATPARGSLPPGSADDQPAPAWRAQEPSYRRPAALELCNLDLEIVLTVQLARKDQREFIDEDEDTDRSPLNRRVFAVNAIDQKLNAARWKLDTVLLARNQPAGPASDLDRIREDQRRAEEDTNGQPYMGIRIDEVDTILSAIDRMLVTNRFLWTFQEVTRDQWLQSWERRTARCAGDEAPGPDDDNLPRSERETQSDDE